MCLGLGEVEWDMGKMEFNFNEKELTLLDTIVANVMSLLK